ncbi:hypothetical protein G7Y89_g15853 [Cudoniella acicularis]|uniref:Uncharacterized protein n=1 Tax=Cudoniella acicularis TaxID=354080 RepID=A0A8H4VHN5_9HELO|nr:hypothetical protein G7Y89_g15853 [Cudoniella acicularis]
MDSTINLRDNYRYTDVDGFEHRPPKVEAFQHEAHDRRKRDHCSTTVAQTGFFFLLNFTASGVFALTACRDGTSCNQLLGISPTTGVLGTLGTVLSRHSKFTDRARLIFKLAILLATWLFRILLFIRAVSLATSFDPIYKYNVTAGVGQFNGSYVISYLQHLQDLEPDYPYIILPYNMLAIAYNLVGNSMHASVVPSIDKTCESDSNRLQSLSLKISQNAILRDAFPYRFYTPPFKMPSMSTLRRPLGLITRNNSRGKELTPKMRNKVYALSENGHSTTYIIGRYKLSRGAIRYTLENESLRPESNASRPRPEVPDAYEEGSKGTVRIVAGFRKTKDLVLSYANYEIGPN